MFKRLLNRSGNYPIVIMAIIWQYVIMAALLWSSTAINATSLYLMDYFLSAPTIWYFMLLSSTLAAMAFVTQYRLDAIIYLLPQQALLLLSAAGPIYAIWTGHFADGVERHRAFILTDQALPIILAIGHAWTLIKIYRRWDISPRLQTDQDKRSADSKRRFNDG